MPARRIVLLVFVFSGALSMLQGQGGVSLVLGTGGEYLLPDRSIKKDSLWRNANVGIPLSFSIEYEFDQFWAGLYLSGALQRWESGPGNPLWPGRSKPIQHEMNWWNGAVSLVGGYRIPIGFRNQMSLKPHVGIGFDRHQKASMCAAGATITEAPAIPVSHVSATSLVQSGILVGGGMFMDYQIVDGDFPIWLRLGVSGWWRQAPLLDAAYHLWNNGGQMPQQPPWRDNAPRPGQRMYFTDCPESFSAPPDYSHDIHLAGHHLNWTIGLRFDL